MRKNLRVAPASVVFMVAVLSGMMFGPDRPVADAAMRGDLEEVRALIAGGADVNAAQGDGMTALHWAAERRDVEMTRLLLAARASVTAVTRIGSYTALHLASKAGSGPIIQALLDAGSDVNAVTTSTGVTPLHLAAASGEAPAVSALLSRGADPNARDGSEWGQTPLMYAAASNGAGAIKVLVERGGDPRLATHAVDVPSRARVDLEAAKRVRQALRGNRQPSSAQVQAAIQAGRDAQRTLKDAEYKLDVDEYGRAVDEVAGIPTLVGSMGGLTALHHAAREGRMEAAVALLDGGADIDQRAGDGTTSLLMASLNGQFDLALILIERGADPNLASHVDMTPLYAVIQTQWAPRSRFPQPRAQDGQKAEYLNVMKALLQAGADPNVRLKTHLWYMEYTFNLLGVDLEGSTAFWRAAYAADAEALRLLAAYGADPEIPSTKPAFDRGQAGEVQIKGSGLREERPDVSGLPVIPVGGPAIYPIHAASGVGYGEGRAANHHRTVPQGWLAAVRVLVDELGADVNARDNMGYTALHHAASRGDAELILFLVSRGADVSAVARTGETVADMANGPHPRGQVYPEALSLLERLGAKNQHWCAAGTLPSSCIRG